MHAEREEDAVAYMSQFDQVDMMGIEFPPYEEPPPPYTPPKPPDYPPHSEEAPPPYTPENNNNEGEGRTPIRPGECDRCRKIALPGCYQTRVETKYELQDVFLSNAERLPKCFA